ncbi:MAG TPA: right-handed parallel beta-helix repeat-containing protein, partial [Solirubrobacteraceae bacterium]|nr:right-handed parallel beta-helix repeat-containing protein [Solirubrobacteraceae bacterium]
MAGSSAAGAAAGRLRLLGLGAALMASLSVPGVARATTYYVASSGSDSASGTSPSSPWRTLLAVDGHRFAPGDSVLLRCGSSFSGPLRPQASGTPSAPVRFDAYGSCSGSSRPLVVDGGSAGIDVEGLSWVTFANLAISGHAGSGGDAIHLGGGSHLTFDHILAQGDTTGVRNDSSSTTTAVLISNSRFVGTGAAGVGIENTSTTSTAWTVA